MNNKELTGSQKILLWSLSLVIPLQFIFPLQICLIGIWSLMQGKSKHFQLV